MTSRAILGGTFDPVHLGHLALARFARDTLGFDEVIFVPAGIPSHRRAPVASAADRLAMVRLAVAAEPRMSVDDIEVRRARPAYTVETLQDLRARWGDTDPLALILGQDAFQGFPGWRSPDTILALGHLVVAGRPGVAPAAFNTPAGKLYTARQIDRATLLSTPNGGIYPAQGEMPDISATAVRDALAHGQDAVDLLPAPVVDYILSKSIYR